jgi:hypothetical protein
MNGYAGRSLAFWLSALAAAPAFSADVKPDLGREQVGKPPTTFEPMVGT